VSAPVYFYLMMLLAFDWCAEIRQVPKWAVVTVILLAVPELFYLGMVLTPSLIAMAMLVGAHLIIRRATAHTAIPAWDKFATSLLLFGIGAACRWDTCTYGTTIVADLFLRSANQSECQASATQRLRLSLGWGVLAGLTWILVLIFNGWGLKSILHTILSQGPVESLDWKLSLARAQTFFTPTLAILSAIGFYVLARNKEPLAAVTIFAILPVAGVILYGVPKWFITAIPSLIGCAVFGLCMVVRRLKSWRMVSVSAVFPWLIGVQWLYGATAWGPGFELQPYYNVGKHRFGPYLAFGPGMAIPTPEGPRPLFGHGWVLLGAWKTFVTQYASEQEAAVLNAVKSGLPLLLDEQTQGWFVSIFASHGYVTRDSEFRTIGENSIKERRWSGPDGSHTQMVQFVKPNDLVNPAAIDRLRTVTGDTVVITAVSRNILQLQQIAPESLEARGKRTALLHLDRLYARLRSS
jgi:hypothetical protein